MEITPDAWTLFRVGPIPVNATLVFTWLVMALLAGGSWLGTRNLSDGEDVSGWQNFLEVVVTGVNDQIRDVMRADPRPFAPLVGTLFLFIAVSNLLAVVPGYRPPTGSLSTTTALALCVFGAAPIFGVSQRGLGQYLANYIRPTPFMLPFNIIGELSRTLALAVRLYGNVMSGVVIGGILISIAPFFFPIIMQLFGMLTGFIQAYIFAILSIVYIAAATQPQDQPGAGEGADAPEHAR